MSIRNVPRSLNCTGGISDCRNFRTTSATPADSILDLFTTTEEIKHILLIFIKFLGRTGDTSYIRGLLKASRELLNDEEG